MTSAELKTLRENLGLSQNWLSARCGVRIRTLAHWEAGANVPEDVEELMFHLLGLRNRLAEQMVNSSDPLDRYKVDEQLWADHPEFEGLPVMFHATALCMAWQKLLMMGSDIQINYVEVEQ